MSSPVLGTQEFSKCFWMDVIPEKCKGMLWEFRRVKYCTVNGKEGFSKKFSWKKKRMDADIS